MQRARRKSSPREREKGRAAWAWGEREGAVRGKQRVMGREGEREGRERGREGGRWGGRERGREEEEGAAMEVRFWSRSGEEEEGWR